MTINSHKLSFIQFLKKLFLLFFFLPCLNTFAQTDSLAIEKLRTESGVDPTRVNSRVGFSTLYFDKANNASSISNKFSVVLGVNRWSFSIKPEIISFHNGIAGTGFETAFSDIKFSILNAFYVKGKNSLAGSVEFSLPFGKQGFGSQIFTATPAITYSYTINPSLFLAVQPQYAFAIAKDNLYPDLSVLTNRIFIAKFTKTGMFYVFEPRTIFDFENENFDLILSPIIGKSLGAGFNLIGLMEIPTKQSTLNNRGVLYQIGFNKNF
ncbi:hypothetical protein WFZ85_15015 [Flavobacterium sp. j3]|uniref:MetA-pathway of phenol degradation n=1 Tax=Flavobacterium aureirubrum TaxID=3133147 RepID=A0ABU9NAJ4_9FLAO